MKLINKDIVSGSLLQRLTLGRNNIPDGRGVLIGHVVLQFDRLPLLSLRGLFLCCKCLLYVLELCITEVLSYGKN